MPTATETATGMSSRAQRLLTTAVALPLALVAVLMLPSDGFFLVILALFGGAAFEYARMVGHWTPSAPLGALPILVAALSGSLFALMRSPTFAPGATSVGLVMIAALALMVTVPALVVLLARMRLAEGGLALGLIGFGVPYFAVPIVSAYRLHAFDPWLVVALLVVVWAGDSVAYIVGSTLGRRKMAPQVSPNKTWEGAAAGLVAGVLAAAIWSALRLGTVRLDLLAVAAAAGVAGQAGDLVESLIKRGAGVKDSSGLLPGHGGLFDRVDALMLATPVWLLGIWAIGLVG